MPLSLTGIRKRFGAVTALDGASCDLRAGGLLGLIDVSRVPGRPLRSRGIDTI